MTREELIPHIQEGMKTVDVARIRKTLEHLIEANRKHKGLLHSVLSLERNPGNHSATLLANADTMENLVQTTPERCMAANPISNCDFWDQIGYDLRPPNPKAQEIILAALGRQRPATECR